ncbi:MAG: mechanosensitive ion channel family protein [Bacteroidota bacterium]|nr:mechanosensitive ion channel family protein [Bacteroidota bacterium]
MNDILNRLNADYHAMLKLLPRLGLALLMFVIGILISGWITSLIRKKISEKSHDSLMSGFLAKAIKMIFIVIVFLLTLNIAGLSNIAGGILGIAGASAVVVGFAFKDIAENFLAGIILAFNRPFHIDDTVQIESVLGKIKAMEFRYTKITTFDGRNVYIPNSDVLTKPVYNYTEDGFFRTDFILGIAYENDTNQAKNLIQQCLDEHHELVHDDVHTNFVVEDEVAPSTVNLKIFIWVETKDFRRSMLEIRGRVITKTKTLLESNGFNLPAAITELKFYDASKPIEISNKEMAAKDNAGNEVNKKEPVPIHQ